MKLAKDFRKSAFEALRGKWGIAVLAAVLASICGAASGPSISFNFSFDSGNDAPPQTDAGFDIDPELLIGILVFVGIALVVGLIVGAIFFILGSTVTLGYAKFNLAIIDNREAKIGNLFEYFNIWKSAAMTQLWRVLYTFLWLLLFIVPGVVASYSYAMTPYIKAEFPEIAPKEAVAASKKLMYGNRYRLFCLDMSFIGWALLCVLTLGIGFLWLNPYMNAARADFYREISGTRPTADVPLDDFFEVPNDENFDNQF